MLRRVLVLLMVVGLGIAMLGATGCRKKEKVEAPEPEKKEVGVRVLPGTEMVPEEFMPKVLFDYDKYDIRADQVAKVDKSVEYLKATPAVKVRIDGNCDERGTSEYNMSLGQKRAETVAAYLTGHGIAKDRVGILSKGKENPADPGHTEAAWAKNRRDEYFYTAK